MTTDDTTQAVTDDELVPIESIQPDPALLAEVQRRRVVTPTTRALLGLVLAAAVFLAGVLVERSQVKTTSSSALPAGLPAGIAALSSGQTTTTASTRGGASRTSTTAGTGAQTTFGTVKLVDGTNVYVSDAQGNVVKVATNGQTKVRVSTDADVSKLAASTTVIVQGTRDKDGVLTATQITETQGGGSGFPGGGLPGGRLPTSGGTPGG